MDDSRFDIPSAILAAAVVEKSKLDGEELIQFAANLQQRYLRFMKEAHKRDRDQAG